MTGRVVALAVLVAILGLVGPRAQFVAAGEPVATVSISSIAIPLGEQGVVEVRASATKPGLGAWTVDLTYDRDVARSVDCEGFNGTHCGRLFEENTDRLTGASATGLVGDTLLATITFECGDDPGWTLLALSLSVFTVADPQDGIDPTGVQNGFVSCGDEDLAPPTTAPLSPPRVGGLPSTGTGRVDTARNIVWAMAALVGLGALGVAGAAVRMRRRR